MKIIINNINIYHIHDNRYYNNGQNNHLNVDYGKTEDADLTECCSHIIVNDNNLNEDTPLIKLLKERVLKSELEVKELIDHLSNENR